VLETELDDKTVLQKADAVISASVKDGHKEIFNKNKSKKVEWVIFFFETVFTRCDKVVPGLGATNQNFGQNTQFSILPFF
jgi:hypothetical protein